MAAGIANEARFAAFAFSTTEALSATSFATAASVALPVEFTEFRNSIANTEYVFVGHIRSREDGFRTYLIAVSLKFSWQSPHSAS